jgi:hypothetical protein
MAGLFRRWVRLGGHCQTLELDELPEPRLLALLGIVTSSAAEEDKVLHGLRLLGCLEKGLRDVDLVLQMNVSERIRGGWA